MSRGSSRSLNLSNKNTLMRRELLELMERYDLNSREVAEIVSVVPTTVRKWRCGVRVVPKYALDLLKLSKGRLENIPA